MNQPVAIIAHDQLSGTHEEYWFIIMIVAKAEGSLTEADLGNGSRANRGQLNPLKDALQLASA